MSMYIFRKAYVCNGYYEEPLDDSFPWTESYTSNISKRFAAGDSLEGDISSSGWFELSDSDYGVSLHGSRAFLNMNVENLLRDGILREATERDINRIEEIADAEEALRNADDRLWVRENYLEELFSDTEFFHEVQNEYQKQNDFYDHVQTLIDNRVEDTIRWIRAKANMMMAKM